MIYAASISDLTRCSSSIISSNTFKHQTKSKSILNTSSRMSKINTAQSLVNLTNQRKNIINASPAPRQHIHSFHDTSSQHIRSQNFNSISTSHKTLSKSQILIKPESVFDRLYRACQCLNEIVC